MRKIVQSAGLLLALGLLFQPSIATASTSTVQANQDTAASIQKTEDSVANKSYVRVLSDHPGSATALTARQKNEIRQILAKSVGNQTFICTAASLAGQRESMYRVVLIRAELVCDYAKSLVPTLTTAVQERTTQARKFNGRVVVVSK